MQLLFLANTQVDWGQLIEGGLVSLVVTAVFVIIVKPLVNQMLKSNAESSKALVKLTETITNGDNSIITNTKEVEACLVQKLNELVEPIAVMKENLREQKEQLNRIEEKIDNK